MTPEFSDAAQLPFTTLHLFMRKHLSLFFVLCLRGWSCQGAFFNIFPALDKEKLTFIQEMCYNGSIGNAFLLFCCKQYNLLAITAYNCNLSTVKYKSLRQSAILFVVILLIYKHA